MRIIRNITALLLFAAVFLPTAVQAQTDTADFFDMSLEDLMGIEVTSVSKKAERLQDVATSIYVITQDDIRRSGAMRLQDLMIMVPGMWMNHHSFNDVSVGMRDDVDDFIGTVLVLVDGVPYQSPYYSSFLYENFEIDLEEIDRIEVIKGPGGTIYGSNAATGIINIYTKNPKDSQGFRVTMNHSVASNSLHQPSIKYGTKVGENSHVSVFGKATIFEGYDPIDYLNNNLDSVTVIQSDSAAQANGQDTTVAMLLNNDIYRSHRYSAGLNFTSQLNDKLHLTYNMAYTHHNRDSYFPTGTSLLGITYRNNRLVSRARFDYAISDDHNLFVNAYVNREALNASFGKVINTSSQVEVQDNIVLGKHTLNIGANVRHVDFEVGPFVESTGINFIDGFSSNVLWGAFAQDKFDISDKFYVMAGVKAEMWDLIDEVPEISPSVRFAFRPNDRHTVWAAGSRSVTTPGFININMELFTANGIPPIVFALGLIDSWDPADGIPLGANKDIYLATVTDIDQAEYLTGELGYRGAFSEKFTFETSLFYALVDNRFGVADLDFNTVIESRVDGDSIVPLYYSNIYKSTNLGAETVLKFKPVDWLTLEVSHAIFMSELEGKPLPNSTELASVEEPENPYTPEHVIRWRTYFTFKNDLYFSMNGFYATPFDGGETFKYDAMTFADPTGLDGPNAVAVADEDPTVRLDFKLEKRFNDDNVSMYIWGNDVLNDGTINDYARFKVGVPQQTHRMFGAGITARF